MIEKLVEKRVERHQDHILFMTIFGSRPCVLGRKYYFNVIFQRLEIRLLVPPNSD
jgi:hypothetical protein